MPGVGAPFGPFPPPSTAVATAVGSGEALVGAAEELLLALTELPPPEGFAAELPPPEGFEAELPPPEGFAAELVGVCGAAVTVKMLVDVVITVVGECWPLKPSDVMTVIDVVRLWDAWSDRGKRSEERGADLGRDQERRSERTRKPGDFHRRVSAGKRWEVRELQGTPTSSTTEGGGRTGVGQEWIQ
jgi:hypothetical protein